MVGSREDAERFQCDSAYAVISFIGHRHHKTPPKLLADPQRLARIVVRADDTYPGVAGAIALSEAQAYRLAQFVRRMEPKIEILFIHCHFGHGRSCGAGIAIARAFGLPWQEFLEGERVGNGHITLSVAHALERIGYSCGDESAAYDRLYLDRWTKGGSGSRWP